MSGCANLLPTIEIATCGPYGMLLSTSDKQVSALLTSAQLATLNRGGSRENVGHVQRNSTGCTLCTPATIGSMQRSFFNRPIGGMESVSSGASELCANVSCYAANWV